LEIADDHFDEVKMKFNEKLETEEFMPMAENRMNADGELEFVPGFNN